MRKIIFLLALFLATPVHSQEGIWEDSLPLDSLGGTDTGPVPDCGPGDDLQDGDGDCISVLTDGSDADTLHTHGDFRGETYYVDQDRPDDTGDGLTPGTAWKTIGKVNGETFNPGDQILFERGDTWTGTSLIPPSSGAEGMPIVFGAYGPTDDGWPTIDGNGMAVANCVYINEKDSITIQNFEITDCSDYGVFSHESHSSTVRNNYIHDVGDYAGHDHGIRMFGVDQTMRSNHLIQGNIIEDISMTDLTQTVFFSGITVQGVRDVIIRDNNIHTPFVHAIRCFGNDTDQNKRVHVLNNRITGKYVGSSWVRTSGGIMMMDCDDSRVSHNVITHGSGGGIQASYGTERIVISHNIIHDMTKNAGSWNGIDINSENDGRINRDGFIYKNHISKVNCHSLRLEDNSGPPENEHTGYRIIGNVFDASENTTDGCLGRKLAIGTDVSFANIEDLDYNTYRFSGDGDNDSTPDEYIIWYDYNGADTFYTLDTWQAASSEDASSFDLGQSEQLVDGSDADALHTHGDFGNYVPAAGGTFTGPIVLDDAVAFGTEIQFADADATPDVSGGRHFRTATPTGFTITNFDDGGGDPLKDGHRITVRTNAATLSYNCTSANPLNCGSSGQTELVTYSGDVTEWVLRKFVYDIWHLASFTMSGLRGVRQPFLSDVTLQGKDDSDVYEPAVNEITIFADTNFSPPRLSVKDEDSGVAWFAFYNFTRECMLTLTTEEVGDILMCQKANGAVTVDYVNCVALGTTVPDSQVIALVECDGDGTNCVDSTIAITATALEFNYQAASALGDGNMDASDWWGLRYQSLGGPDEADYIACEVAFRETQP